MDYVWNDSLVSGNAILDEQHKQLFSLVKAFDDACKNGQGAAEIKRTLDFLIDYTIEHFKLEEDLQKQYNYPEYMRHRQYHREFTRAVCALADRLEQEGPTPSLTKTLLQTAGDWLIHHIKSDDFVLATFLLQQKG